MSYQRHGDHRSSSAAAAPASGEPVPGKRTLTEALPRAGGAPLPAGLRAELGGALGADLTEVRLHGDAAAAGRAASLDAAAYAVGQDIHLGAGAPALDTPEGRHLIAHEVAHTVQQQGAAPTIQRAALVSTPGDAAEREAERFAAAFAVGANTTGLVTAGLQPAAAIHRYGLAEHHDIPTRYLLELQEFLGTPEGLAWAQKNHVDAADVAARMKTDPAALGKKLHGTFVNKAKEPGAKEQPTEFDYGDPTAMMGDLFGTWKKVRGVSQDDHDALMKDGSTAEVQKLTKGEYLRLAMNNANHYAGLNKQQWRAMHEVAIQAARAATTPEQREEAEFIEASGAHFLTDAFAAGHQFQKQVLLADILGDLAARPFETKNPELGTVVASFGTTNLAQMILKLIHDRMNAEGFEVENDRGMTWKTFGDGHLARSPETQHVVALAVFESRQQVLAAEKRAVAPGEIDEVAKYMPNAASMRAAEEQARRYIPEARSQVEALIWRERASAPGEIADRMPGGAVGKLFGRGIGTILEKRIDSIADPGWEKQVLEDRAAKDAIGQRDAPTFDGGFTLTRF